MNLLSDTCNYKDFKYFIRYILFRIIPSIFYSRVIKHKYKKTLNEELNLKKPKKLSEKVQWLKLNYKNKHETMLSDKLLAKKFIKENLPELNTTQVYQVKNCFSKLNFEELPESFVIKTNHAWRTNVIIRNKSLLTKRQIKIIKNYYDWVLKINYAYWSYFELQYKNIVPQVFIEEYIYNNNNIILIEYEAYCFNGKVEFIKIGHIKKEENENYTYRKSYYCDTTYKKTQFAIRYKEKEDLPEKSKNFDKMIQYAQFLSRDFPFVRVDFMEAKNILYFGEMTFTPYCGFLKFNPKEYDKYFGEKLKI